MRAVRDPFEDRLFSEQARIEEEAVRLLADSPEAAAEFLTAYTRKAMEEVHLMFLDLRGTLITKYTNNRE
mgnify:FL=1